MSDREEGGMDEGETRGVRVGETRGVMKVMHAEVIRVIKCYQ